MLVIRIKRLAAKTARAFDPLAAAEASVVALGDEDLLDLPDIFALGYPTPPREIAMTEMHLRGLSL